MNILILQNFHLTPPGVLGQCVQQRGGSFVTLFPTKESTLPDHTKYDGLIILGGPMHAEDDQNYPQLKGMINLILQFYSEQKPVLGVCLGAQIIARAFGGRVYKHLLFELGFKPVLLVAEDKLLGECLEELYVMQWHFDTFDLPEEATLLMCGKQCHNQVFRIGNNIYGFQFHLEVTREILQNWIDSKDEFVERNYPEFLEQLTLQMERYLEDSMLFCHQVVNAWLDLVESRIHMDSTI